MKYPHLRGKRFANWARRSDIVQDASIDDQIATNNHFAEEHEMIHIKDFALEGTGSIPGARDDIEEVILDAERNEVEVLLLYDVARLTRSGVEHGMKVLYDVKSHGMEAVFVRDDVPGGEWAAVFQTLLLFAANQSSKKLADASARSWQIALEKDQITTSKMTPYGLDRLVLNEQRERQFRVRNLTNGDQLKLHPHDDAIIYEYYKRDEDGKRGFYSRQSTEITVLVEGEKEAADIVRWMFRRYLADGSSYNGIRRDLNERGIPSPRGKKWTNRTITQILRNPAYTGRCLWNSHSAAVYVKRSPGQPMPANVSYKTLATRNRPPRQRRPASDWQWRKEPLIENFLPADIKILAVAYQERHFEKIKNGYVSKPGGNRHFDGEFILSGILRNSAGESLNGYRNNGNRAYTTRYVVGVKRRIIPADALERAVLGAVRETIITEKDVMKRVRGFIEQELASASSLRRGIDDIRKHQQRLLGKISYLLERASTLPEVRQVSEKKIAETETELEAVRKDLRKAEGQLPSALSDIEGAVNAVSSRLEHFGKSLQAQAASSVKRLLMTLIESIEVDEDTLRVELKLRLPATAIYFAYENRHNINCPVPIVDPKVTNWTVMPGVDLGAFECISNGMSRYKRLCWWCCRRLGDNTLNKAA